MVFHHPNKRLPQNFEIKINNTLIERSREFCFLGLTINEHLTWKTHINKIYNQVSKYTGILNKMKRFLPQNILRTLRILQFNTISAKLLHSCMGF